MNPTTKSLDDILKQLSISIPEVKSAAFISRGGDVIASTFPEGVHEWGLGGMTVSFFYLAEKAVIEMSKGEFDEVLIKTSEGYIMIKPTGFDAIFLAYLTDIHRIFIDFRGTSERIAKLI